MDPFAYLVEHEAAILELLKDFVRIPSVSTDPAFRPHIYKAANWVADQIGQAGPFNVRMITTERYPIIYADWTGAAPGAPTIIVYGHYDVQPPDPFEAWNSPPFVPEVRDGRLYGRGVSDDKGPLLIVIKVAEAFFRTHGKLPVNVKFVIEGEEETGSPSLSGFVERHKKLLKADFVLSADGAMWRDDVPSLTVANRGVVGLEFSLRGAKKDLHSGRYGGAVINPLHAISQLVASLHDDQGRVAIEGFYDAVVEIDPAEHAALAALPFDDADWLDELGGDVRTGEAGYTTLERLWRRPTLDLNGLWGGYQGPGGKTVIPNVAHVKLSCRLVPNQDPEDIQAKVVRHLETHLPPGTHLSVSASPHSSMPYRIPNDHNALSAASDVLADLYGVKPVHVSMGGSIPIGELFNQAFDIETVFFSFSTADEDFHAPNEFFRLSSLRDGLRAWADLWMRLGEQRKD